MLAEIMSRINFACHPPRSAILSMALGLCVATQAQSYDAVPTLNAQAIYAHSEFLSSDLLEGRATGSRGYELAAAYVASQFRQYGLIPISELRGDKSDGGYLQAVPLIEATVVLPGSSASLRRDGTTVNFEFSRDYLPSANFFNANSALTAPLVFAGYGIDAPELKYNDFADLDLQGRIAVILKGTPERFSREARSYYGWQDTKYEALVKQGALGVIEIDNRDRKDNDGANRWERAVAMSWVSEMRRINSDDLPNERFAELKLKFRFSADAAAQLFGNGHSFEQVLQAAKNGDVQGFALPGVMNLSATTGLRRVESNNVLGVVRGADPHLQDEYVLVTANLDHLGRGAGVGGDTIYNGFQHNAVGVAMLLDMARSIASMPDRPRRSILFAAVTAGDKGAQGLEYLLNDGPIATRNIVAGVSLDMPLPITRTRDVLAAGADQSSIGPLLVNSAQQMNLRVVHADEPYYSILEDALAPMVRANIPVLSLHGGLRARGSRIDVRAMRQEWLQLHLNQPSDDARTMPLNAVAARELAAVNVLTVLQLANAPERPVWYRSSLIHRKLSQD